MATPNVRIQFTGLMLFLPQLNPVEVVIPRVRGDQFIGRHRAYIAFRSKDADCDWDTTALPDHKDFSFFPLTGETIYLNCGGMPLEFMPFLPELKKYCPRVAELSPKYATHESQDTAGHVILTGGDIGWHVPQSGRIDTVIEMISKDPLTLTGIKGGQTRFLRFHDKVTAGLVIGNTDINPIPMPHDFLFYFRMFEAGGPCMGLPSSANPDKNPKPKEAVLDVKYALDIACSNSQYP